MARPTIKFSIRFLMLCVLAACIGMAWIAYVRNTGIRQAQSIKYLNESGCWILPGHQLNTVPSTTQPGRYLQTRSHGPGPGPFSMEWLFGRDSYLETSDAVIEDCYLPLEELASHLRNLRKLEYVFYTPKFMDDNQAKQLQDLLPGVKVLSGYTLGEK